MNFTVFVVELNSLGPVKFYIYMMIYLTALVWWLKRSDA